MIKENFQKFLKWFKDHFLFLLEVVIRLSVGLREENNLEPDHHQDDARANQKGGSKDDC